MRGSVQTKWRAIVGRRLPQSYQYTQYGHSEMGLVLANLQTTVLNGLWRAEHSHITWKREGTIENVHLLWPENRCLHLDLYTVAPLNYVQISPLTVTLFTVTPRFQWHFWHVPNDWFVTKLHVVTVTIWLQYTVTLFPCPEGVTVSGDLCTDFLKSRMTSALQLFPTEIG